MGDSTITELNFRAVRSDQRSRNKVLFAIGKLKELKKLIISKMGINDANMITLSTWLGKS